MKKPRHYIVVDDDSTNNMICEFTIKRFDKEAEIKLFVEPEMALETIKEVYGQGGENKPTVLFLDINMPTMTGWEVLEVFKGFSEAVKDQFTIYILSSSIEEFEEEAKLYPFVSGFLSKPLKVGALEKIMK